MTKTEFVKPFTLLCEMYNREASHLLMEGYYLVLSELSKEEFESSIKQILSSRKYSTLPLPADLLEAVLGNQEDKAILALKELEDAMDRHGAYKSVSFQDDIISTCVQNLGGWVTVCQMELKDWEWKKKEFLSLYKTLMRNPNKVSRNNHLVGICEHQNRHRGFDEIANETQVMMIGYGDKTTMPLLELVSGQISTSADKDVQSVKSVVEIGLKRF